MITRIRASCAHAQLRCSLLYARASSSSSTSSRGPGRPRKSERIDDYTVAPDPSVAFTSAASQLQSRDGSRISTSNRDSKLEAPILKANQYAGSYRSPDVVGPPGVDCNSRDSGIEILSTRNKKPQADSTLGTSWLDFGEAQVRVAEDGLWYRETKGIESPEPGLAISYYRLRDACPCPRCIDPSTRQRTHTSGEAFHEVVSSTFVSGNALGSSGLAESLKGSSSVPHDVEVGNAGSAKVGNHIGGAANIHQDEVDGCSGLRVNWSPHHSAFYPLSRVVDLATGHLDRHVLMQHAQRYLWSDKDQLLADSKNLYVPYAALAQADRDQTLLDMLIQLQRFGIVVIKGVPTAKTGDDDCTLREVMSWIGDIRHTFYGATWNVKNIANSKNVAYTNLNLGLHMDLLYFSSPPRFQALHCLRNRVEGGSSYFVDGMAAVHRYQRSGRPNFDIEYEYDNDSHYLRHKQPIYTGPPHLYKSAVNWSPPFQAMPRPRFGGDSLKEQNERYSNLSAFQKSLDRPKAKWEFTMEEGDLVLFDNRRVLHARTAFRDLTEEEAKARGVKVVQGEPSRWLKGCYLDGETVWDKLVTLGRKLDA